MNLLVLLLRRFGSKYIVRQRYDFKSGFFLNHLAKPCILSVSRQYIRLHIHGRDRMVIKGTTNYAISANTPKVVISNLVHEEMHTI
jgi:hypothetical protein